MNNAIEESFRVSWLLMHRFFEELANKHGSSEHVRPMLTLIEKFQICGYDGHFRAGQSLYYFKISRAARHGLRRMGDPVITFLSLGEDRFRLWYINRSRQKEAYDLNLLAFNPTQNPSVQHLLQCPIH